MDQDKNAFLAWSFFSSPLINCFCSMPVHVHTAALAVQTVALAFLIIACVTAPATQSLALGHAGKYTFGALGVCSEGSCTASLGYDLASMVGDQHTVLANDKLNTLTKVLVVCPIAGFLTLVSLILNTVAQFALFLAGSGTFWVLMMVWNFLAFAGSAIGCIIAFLLFYPNVDWPAWCLIPAAVLNMVAVVLYGLAWNLLPVLLDSEQDDEIEEKTINTYPYTVAEESTSFNYAVPAPLRTQLDVSSSKNDVNVHVNEFSEEDDDKVSSTSMLNSGTSSSTNQLLFHSGQGGNATSQAINGRSVQGDSVYSSTAQIPRMSNPYMDSANPNNVDSKLTIDDDELTKNHSASSSESNFTSISQRGVNPRYYAGAPNKPQMFNNPNGQNMPPRGPPHQQQMGPNQYYPQQQPPPQRYYPQQPFNGPVRYQNPPMHSQPPTRGPYMNKPKPYMMMNNNYHPPAQGMGFPPPQNQHNYANGPPGMRGGPPPMPGYGAGPPAGPAGGYKNRQRPNLPSASQSREGAYGIY